MIRTLIPLAALFLALPAWGQNRSYASSYKKDSRYGEGVYNYSSALDSDPKTVWQTNPEMDNTKQWIEIDVPTSKVAKLAAVIGWDKSEEVFKDYGRMKTAKIEIFDKVNATERKQLATAELTFKDEQGWQILDLPETEIGQFGGIVRVNITDFYKGVDYSNLAIGELRVHLSEFPADTVALKNTPASANEAKNDASMAFDDNDRSYFIASAKTAEILVEAPGYGVSTVGLVPGPKTHARPKKVRVKSVVLDQVVEHDIAEDAKGTQWLLIPIVKGYTGGAWGEVSVEVLETWPGTVADNPLALGEVRMRATTIEEF